MGLFNNSWLDVVNSLHSTVSNFTPVCSNSSDSLVPNTDESPDEEQTPPDVANRYVHHHSDRE